MNMLGREWENASQEKPAGRNEKERGKGEGRENESVEEGDIVKKTYFLKKYFFWFGKV